MTINYLKLPLSGERQTASAPLSSRRNRELELGRYAKELADAVSDIAAVHYIVSRNPWKDSISYEAYKPAEAIRLSSIRIARLFEWAEWYHPCNYLGQ